MINPLYLPELREMLAVQDADELREFCVALHPARTAEFMAGLNATEAWTVLQYTDPSTRGEIFGYFDEEKQVEIVELGEREQIGKFFTELPADDRVDLLNQVDPKVVEELLPLIPTAERRDILRLRAYLEGTAGSLMTTEFARLSETCDVKQALEDLGRQSEELETIYYVYVVDEADHLRGLVSARQLLSSLGKPESRIGQIMERDLVTVNVTDDQERMAAKVAHYDLLAIPVVDAEHRLLGIITHDDVIDVVREEATEDAHRLSAVAPLQSGYLQTHWFTLTWKRGLWLVILLFAALLTAFALHSYQHYLAEFWLVLFIPLVISSGGNAGSQSATLIITALTTGDLTLYDWLRVVRRELLMGLCLGGFLAVISYMAACVLAPDPFRAIVIPITVILVVVCGTLFGSVLPLIFRRLGLDPALMSNPFVAAIIDVLGILIYIGVVVLVLVR